MDIFRPHQRRWIDARDGYSSSPRYVELLHLPSTLWFQAGRSRLDRGYQGVFVCECVRQRSANVPCLAGYTPRWRHISETVVGIKRVFQLGGSTYRRDMLGPQVPIWYRSGDSVRASRLTWLLRSRVIFDAIPSLKRLISSVTWRPLFCRPTLGQLDS